VVADHGLKAGDSVGLDAPLTGAGTFVAGVLAPMTVGATIHPQIEQATVGAAPAYVVRSDGRDHDDGLDPSTVPVVSTDE
jgi:hypothetical protein